MNKEDVLKKAQNQKRHKLDEMEVDVLLRGNRVGLIVGLCICMIIMGVKLYRGQAYQDIYSVFCAIFCGQSFYKGVRLKDRSTIVLGVLWGISSLLLLIGYFI